MSGGEGRHGSAPLAMTLTAALTLVAPPFLVAQGTSGQGIGLEVDGGYRVLAGDELAGLEDGWATHALGSYTWRTGWEAGVGVGVEYLTFPPTTACRSAPAGRCDPTSASS